MTIFRQIHELENGLKTVTRRVEKPGEKAIVTSRLTIGELTITHDSRTIGNVHQTETITAIRRNGRLAYEVGRDYAIVPKRGQAGIGRYQLLRIEQEPLQDITEESAAAEGFDIIPGGWYVTSVLPNQFFSSAREGYEALWESINGKSPYRWSKNPLVWVQTIKVLHINGKQVSA